MKFRNIKNQIAVKAFLIVSLCLSLSMPLIAAPDDINIMGANAIHTYNLTVNQNFNEQIAVLNATGNVFWDFNSTPVATTGGGSTFTDKGITVTLPAGAPGSDVSSGSTVSLMGTPTLPGSFSFTLTVTSLDGTITQNRTYEVIISQPMDLVLVFDRSGSMSSNTTSGQSRWDALKASAALFLNAYQQTNRPNDRIAVTYFETDLLPPSTCCNNFIPWSGSLQTTISTDLNANSPGGGTGMGAGLISAQDKLTDPNKARSILLFTDGEQNRDPEVDTNGLGFNNGIAIKAGVKISTIGIGSPSMKYNTVLQNLAVKNRGSYNITTDGSAFTFKAGLADGDLTSGFSNQFVSMLAAFSPQMVAKSTTDVSQGASPHALISFPLNKRVGQLLMEISFDKFFERAQILQTLARILIQKDGASVMANIQPSWAGNYTNTILLKIDFLHPTPSGIPPFASEGNWTVQLTDAVTLKVNQCRVTVMADDHRLNYTTSYGTTPPKVNAPLTLSVDLDWLSYPISNATVEAIVLRPGEDLGDLLAKHSLITSASDPDLASPGVQKFNELWATDQAFKDALALSENVVTLANTTGGHYEGTFNGLNVAGLYSLVYRISGNHPDAGDYRRIVSENFYASFNGIDLAASGVTTQMIGGNLVVQMRPMTPYGRFIGPAAADAFAVNNVAVQISNIIDHQDGRYTITFNGNPNEVVTLSILNQEVYTGKLADIGKSGGGGIIGHIKEWLHSLGLPPWSLWAILLLVLILLWLLFKKKS